MAGIEIVHVYQKKRREFGRHANFHDRAPQLHINMSPSQELADNFTIRNPCHTGIQTAPEFSAHEAQTERYFTANAGVVHTEGGWPKDVDKSDVEQTIRHRKKIEKEPTYGDTIRGLSDKLEHCVRQNNAIDIYENYITEAVSESSDDAPSAKTVNVFRDPSAIKRTASCISWYPDGAHQLAVAYSILDFQKQPYNMSVDSYIWDIHNPNTPLMALTPTSPIVSLQYNPKDPHILAGGSHNGLIGIWDIRKGSSCIDSSIVQNSHRDPVYSLSWIQSKTGTELMSASTDGQVLWWDTRKLGEPVETLQLDTEKFGTGRLGGVSLDYDFQMPTKFMVGSEQGVVASCNRKAKNPADRIVQTYPGHLGPVYTVRRNPFFQKNFLTIGDWTAKIWSEDLRTPIMWTRNHSSYLMDGCWSPTRPGVFFTAKMDGTLDIWDYLHKQKTTTLSVKVSEAPIYSLKVEDSGRMIACGSKDGSCTLLELNSGLSTMQPNEKQTMGAIFERETRREKILADRARDLMLKAKQQQNRPKQTGPSAEEIELQEEAATKLTDAEKEFFETIGEFKASDKSKVSNIPLNDE